MNSRTFINEIDNRAEEIIERAVNVYHYNADDLENLENKYDLANIMPTDEMYDFCMDCDVTMIGRMLAGYMRDIREDLSYHADCTTANFI